ncbi:MAG: type VII secretion protein EssC, partial [Oscillospiraceae bacterium]|nr:type VII secretion protein EssC [Oscillospiraceae bacterium]
MNLVLIIHFNQSFFEFFLPAVNNRATQAEIPASVSGFGKDIALPLEVWEGEWAIPACAELGIPERLPLRGGLRVNCAVAGGDGEKFVTVVEDVPEEYTAFEKFRLVPGRFTIGREPGNNIRLNTQGLVSGRHAAVDVGADGRCTVHDSSRNGTFVNGRRIDGSRELVFGDVVGVFGLKLVFLGDALAINRPSEDCALSGFTPYAPPPEQLTQAEDGDGFYQRSPRLMERLDDEIIEIEAPPNQNRSRRQPLIFTIGPSITMVIPMAAGAIFTMAAARQSGQTAGAFMFMGIITSVTAAVIGIFWALMNLRYQKRMETEEAARRAALFKAYLERMRAILEEKQDINREILEKLYPHISECARFTRPGALRLWERNVNHRDFLSVRLGIGDLPSPNAITTPKEKFVLTEDDLAEEPRRLRDEFKLLRGAPVTLSLSEHRLVGVITGADGGKTARIARLLAVQLAAYHSYTDLRMAFIYEKADADKYGFARWLPHVWSEDGETRMLAEDANGAGEVLYSISSVLRTRLQDDGENTEKSKQRALPHYVIFVASPSLIEGEAMGKYLNAPAEELGISVVLLYGSIGLLPNGCSVLIRDDAEFSGYCSLDGAFDDVGGVAFDDVTGADAGAFARSLSGFRIREEQSAGAAPSMLSFLDMYGVSRADELDVYRNWLNNRSFESMRAMIGYRSADTPLYLDIHEKYHGPHGLVAGTTGSGKSETLQTYILSLAVSFDPREVSFILIDYKGGGMAKSFEGMPHVAGIITNLGGNQTNRALASINSEIKRRQAVFNEYGVKHIDEYIEIFRAGRAEAPTPHLLIISDEFAELKKEQPEFVRELVSAARVGRSLGVHLILATQDPSASVDDEIWSNSKFRLCLRVAGKQNSQAMLHRPDAAYITNAGRGYFQVGNDEIFELFQSGWSGAEYEPEIPHAERARGDIQMINLWGKAAVKPVKKKSASGGGKVTQLAAVVRHITEVAEEKRIGAISDIWLPPLPERVTLDELDGAETAPGSLAVTLGLADHPTGQRQFAYGLDLAREGHLLIAGPGGAGKTTLLQTLLYSLASRYTPRQVNFYIADFNSRTLGVFSKLP